MDVPYPNKVKLGIYEYQLWSDIYSNLVYYPYGCYCLMELKRRQIPFMAISRLSAHPTHVIIDDPKA